MPTTTQVDIVVIGAGVIGLAVANELAKRFPNKSIAIVEKHEKFGREISSHNSEVVHAGIYYEPGSLKAISCVEGKVLLEEYCSTNDIPILKCGKFIIATSQKEDDILEKIFFNAQSSSVHLERFERIKAQSHLNNKKITSALWSEGTGILDTHSLMQRLEIEFLNSGNLILYKHFLSDAKDSGSGWALKLTDPNGQNQKIQAELVISCAGLAAKKVADYFGAGEHFQIKACRGRYFSLSTRWTKHFKQLIYPVPNPAGGLGIHLTFDLSGQCRLGPDVDWSAAEDTNPEDWKHYRFEDSDNSLKNAFFNSGQKIIPDLAESDLQAGYIGVRPKLFITNQAHPEFVIEKCSAKSGSFWQLLGIESPGITSALYLAKYVADSV